MSKHQYTTVTNTVKKIEQQEDSSPMITRVKSSNLLVSPNEIYQISDNRDVTFAPTRKQESFVQKKGKIEEENKTSDNLLTFLGEIGAINKIMIVDYHKPIQPAISHSSLEKVEYYVDRCTGKIYQPQNDEDYLG
jgi:hypothetical protein